MNKLNIINAFIQVARENPQRTAVKYWQDGKWEQISYFDLLDQAQSTASWLRDLGVVKGEAVILPSQRSPRLCGQLLGFLWAGAHYVFLDNCYPIERQKFICSEVGAKVGIFEEDQYITQNLPIQWQRIPQDLPTAQGPEVSINPELPAYVMFTSGSTGVPKGAVISHRGVCRLVLDTDYICFNKEQVFLQLSALSFDASTLEIWGPLLNGGVCVIYPDNEVPNSFHIRDTIESCGVTTLWLTSSLYNTIISEHPECLLPIKQLLIGGEALSVAHVRKGLQDLSDTQIFNGYGPTENTTFTTIYPIPRVLPDDMESIPIGFPIKHTHCEVFDENLRPLEDGQQGELLVFGDGLAIGYLNNPDLTQERFVEVACRDGKKRRGYRTGDLVVKQNDGSFKFLGRKDKQVKIDGHRIEPGEIEFVLNNLDEVIEARVVVKTGPQGQKRLAAYLVGTKDFDRSSIRSIVSDKLPGYMVPHFFVPIFELPKNQNGKLDEARLPDPFQTNENIGDDNKIVATCWQQILGRAVSAHDNFLDAGGTSLEALQLTELLERRFNRNLGATFVFEYPTIKAQAKFLSQDDSFAIKNVSACEIRTDDRGIAVVGIACRLPGAHTLDEYWENLLNSKESISFFSEAELSDEVDQDERNHPNYVRARGIIEDCDQFDAAFFGISPVEARILDPQQRIMLQLAWHALENAGYPPGDNQYRTGVFAGMNWARYFQHYVLNNEEVKKKFGFFNACLANESDFLCPRISYKLNLTGPSVNIFTACSTGLVAIAEACTNIERGECEMALAGGASITIPVKSGYLYQEGEMLSHDGHCRPFDAKASGTTFNDGAGFVVLKRMDLALRDSDCIYAVVKGWAVNNDGENKASFTAPSVAGQVEVYEATLAKAGVAPQTVGLIETHGTATPLGDPIEVKALAKSYPKSAENPAESCALGSVKSNIGHTIHAAGVAGFIKAVKAVETGIIPPTLFFSTPNPKLELEKTPFFVNNEISKWPKEGPRRAAVSSLGVGGTNAHVIVEQFDVLKNVSSSCCASSPPHPAYPILISAKDQQSLEILISRYQKFFAAQKSDDIAKNASFTTTFARRHFQYRAAVSGFTPAEIANHLNKKKNFVTGQVVSTSDAKLGFMFSGQGSQRILMGHWLYQNSDCFRKIIDEGSEIVLAKQGFDPRLIMFEGEKQDASDLDINQTKIAQPALFLIEYGLATYLGLCGCRPDFLIGHSIGEFPAAVLAGIFTFEEGVELVSLRGALMQSMPAGKMLSVKATADQVEDLLQKGLCLAAVNAPDRIVLSGSAARVQEAATELSSRKIANSVLYTSHAFHSEMMEPIIPEFQERLGSINLREPQIPIFSTATGNLLTGQEATSPQYWAMQLRQAVRFADAITAARNHYPEQSMAFLEVGPGIVLSTLVGCQNATEKNLVLATTPGCGIGDEFIHEFSQCLNNLWVSGNPINWSVYFRQVNARKTRLPGYAFLPNKHWLTSPVATNTVTSTVPANLAPPPTRKQEIIMSQEEHLKIIGKKLRELLEDVTGYDLSEVKDDDHFNEAGLDSLLLTQVATVVDREYSLGISFRDLVEDYTSIGKLRDFIAEKVPPETKEVSIEAVAPFAGSPVSPALAPLPQLGGAGMQGDSVQQLIAQQLQIMQLQLQALSGTNISSTPMVATSSVQQTEGTTTGNEIAANQNEQSPDEKPQIRHTPGTRISREKIGLKLTKAQQQWLNEMMGNYQNKFAKSKEYTQKHRKHLSDPRSVSGFNPEWKEMIFSVVTQKSKGSKLWDIDGNELIDISNGFGPIFFGHSPDFITEAVKQQLDLGVETGPQSPLAGEVAELFCELTGNERCTFANTGSEAVVGAIRAARTVTGRQKVVMFEGSYHGIFDEVINRPGKNFQALPAAPGIAREMTSNMLVLPWGDEESLEALKDLSPDLAAVLVEPVQSRHPEFHDPDYLRAIRKITKGSGTAMILDEVVTGFRVHPGGIRKRFEIDADLATYGKVLGGGFPIGIIGGKARFMDAFDGGSWQYGDNSIPECGVTFFAGTFVRHPLALAAAKAVMLRIKAEGGEMYEQLEKRTSEMATDAKAFIKQLNCDVKFEEFASIFYISVPANSHWGHMLFAIMLMEGIHVQQFRPNFLTTAHSREDIAAILLAFKKSLAQMVAHGLIEGDIVAANKFLSNKPNIPPNAKLGKNIHGEPAYFVEDPNNKGKYIEVGKP